MKKRFLALTMIAALLLPVLAGCGQTEPQAGSTGVRGSSGVPPLHQASAAPQIKVPSSNQDAAAAPATQSPTPLTQEEAEAIALAHVGLTQEAVTRLHTEYDVDDGIPQYEIEFYQGGWEYDFEIHAQTGAILSRHKDYESKIQSPPWATAPTAPTTSPTASTALTKEEAKAIALKYAGFAETEVTRLHTEYDVDDGVPHYDVDFYKDGWEYDFEIHAESGTVLSYEKDDSIRR